MSVGFLDTCDIADATGYTNGSITPMLQTMIATAQLIADINGIFYMAVH